MTASAVGATGGERRDAEGAAARDATGAVGAAVEASQDQGGSGTGFLPSLGAIGAAFLASLCCVGPLLFITLGVGAGLASTFEPLRPLFTALTALFLGVGFYVVYGRGRAARRGGAGGASPEAEACAPGQACAVPRSRRREKALLWTATALAVVLWSFLYWSEWLLL